MRILIDVNHPAHVHLFRLAAREWENHGHEVFWTARDKDIVVALLRNYGFEFQVLSAHRGGWVAMAMEVVRRDWKLLRIVCELKPDIMLGTSVNIAHVSRVVPAHSIFFTESDPDLIRLISYLAFPFADLIVMPDVLSDLSRFNTIRHNSYHELAYLHPDRYIPDPSILDELGVDPAEPFFIMRFISWGASHDVGEKGLGQDARLRLLETLLRFGRVFITSESQLQPELEPYRIHIAPHHIHHAMHYAKLFVGDSQTMTVESAVLGTPALRCNSMVGRTTIIDELEYRYDLAYGFLPNQLDELTLKIEELLRMHNLKAQWLRKRNRLLENKIDLTAWMVHFVEHYGQSLSCLKP